MNQLEHYYKKWKEWDKNWRKDVKELGYSRMRTDLRLKHLIKLQKGLFGETPCDCGVNWLKTGGFKLNYAKEETKKEDR